MFLIQSRGLFDLVTEQVILDEKQTGGSLDLLRFIFDRWA
jgi:hypothetical protein